MKALVAIAILTLTPVAATAAFATDSPSHDSCHSLSLHGVWDCR
jgi:hypothetical protein